MAKSKKSDLEKPAKDKSLKGSKEARTGKEKKGRKKDKVEESKAPKKVVAAKPEPKAAKPKKAVKAVFTTEEISLRAYFIAERRQAMGWPGDSTSDWVEAERQLKAEAAKGARL